MLDNCFCLLMNSKVTSKKNTVKDFKHYFENNVCAWGKIKSLNDMGLETIWLSPLAGAKQLCLLEGPLLLPGPYGMFWGSSCVYKRMWICASPLLPVLTQLLGHYSLCSLSCFYYVVMYRVLSSGFLLFKWLLHGTGGMGLSGNTVFNTHGSCPLFLLFQTMLW
jgi:hypothetical protein